MAISRRVFRLLPVALRSLPLTAATADMPASG